MHFAQHLILSWFVAEGVGLEDRLGRRLVTWAGVIPDVDVVPYALAAGYNILVAHQAFGQAWITAFNDVHKPIHHHYTHGIGFVLLTGLTAYLLLRWRARTAGDGGHAPHRFAGQVAWLAMATSTLHILCDVIASGPTWPVYPLWPVDRICLGRDIAWGYSWSWTLADWPNLLILGLLLLAARQYACWRGRSPIEAFSVTLDQRFVRLVRGRPEETRSP